MCLPYQLETGIGYQRCTSVGHQRDIVTGCHLAKQQINTIGFVVLVALQQRRIDAACIEEPATVARVFHGHQLNLTQNSQRAFAEIRRIANWGSDYVELARHRILTPARRRLSI